MHFQVKRTDVKRAVYVFMPFKIYFERIWRKNMKWKMRRKRKRRMKKQEVKKRK